MTSTLSVVGKSSTTLYRRSFLSSFDTPVSDQSDDTTLMADNSRLENGTDASIPFLQEELKQLKESLKSERVKYADTTCE